MCLWHQLAYVSISSVVEVYLGTPLVQPHSSTHTRTVPLNPVAPKPCMYSKHEVFEDAEIDFIFPAVVWGHGSCVSGPWAACTLTPRHLNTKTRHFYTLPCLFFNTIMFATIAHSQSFVHLYLVRYL